MNNPIGKCSHCGGNVVDNYNHLLCTGCGRTKETKKLPVIEMEESVKPKLLLD